MKPQGRTACAIVLGVVVLALAPPLDACGPFLERAIFSFTRHPDMPLAPFAEGQLGVLERTYARSYLAVAYRHLTGAPLDADEQRGAVNLWNTRFGMWDDRPLRALDGWLTRRRGVPGTAPPAVGVELFRRVPSTSFTSYLNCPADAFTRASATFDSLSTARGAASGDVAEWSRAQDIVFGNCATGGEIPAPLPAGTASDARAHRAYQIAAASFYAGRFDDAEAAFRDIAGDRSSPWRTLAPYLVARTLVRRATLTAPDGAIDRAAMERADAQIASVLQDRDLAEVHEAARRLRGFVQSRLDPVARLREVSATLSMRRATVDFGQHLADFTLLMDRIAGETAPSSVLGIPATVREVPVADWIVTFQATDAASLDHAVERWTSTKSPAWLVAVLSKIQHDDPRAASAISAAEAAQPSSPAFASARFHALRLDIAAGRPDAARAGLDAILDATGRPLPASARNRLLTLRFAVASSFDELLRFAPRAPAAATLDMDDMERMLTNSRVDRTPGLRVFDRDAADVLNDRLPVTLLGASATHPALPRALRRQTALATWTRAALLGDIDTAVAIAPVVGELVPEMREGLAAYEKETDADARAFAGLVLMLKTPGVRPFVDAGLSRDVSIGRVDNYRDNWWCAKDPVPGADGLAFLSAAERAAAAAERARLRALGTAPNHLAEEAVRLATKRPDDPDAPEALALAVRATRYGCTDESTGAASRRAFELLHKKYPKSAAAQRTPFWFR